MTDHSWIRKIFKNKFSRFVNKKKINKERQKPSLLHLEDRLVPAVPFVQTPFGVNIQPLYSRDAQNMGTFTEAPSYKVTFSYPVTGVDPSDFQFSIVDNLGTLTGSAVTSTVTQVTSSEYLLNVTQYAKAPTVSTFTGQIKVSLASNATISQELSFAPQQTFSVGSLPNSATMGDVDGDGRLDIVTANGYSNNVSVLLGNSNGTFKPKANFATGTNPQSVTLGDVNRDGKLDIITANNNSTNVSVLLGNGNGTFKPKVDYATGKFPQSVTLGDVNADGRLDIITADRNSNTVSVLLSTGSGFKAQTFTTGTKPVSVTLGDLNGDGRLDIIAANFYSTSVSVLLGNGNGTFKPKADFAAGFNPKSVTLGDVNGDGRLDIVCANNGSADVSVLLANGGSNISNFSSNTVNINVGSNTLRDVQMADMNGDGNLDLLTTSYASSGGGVILNLGNGNGTFKTFTSILTKGTRPYSIQVADINRDGKLDVVASLPTTANFATLLGNGNGTFKAPASVASTANNFNFVLTDINNDGILDIVTEIGNGSTTSSSVGVLLGNGNGTFKAQTTFSPGTGVGIVNLANGDVNGDGNMDIVTANYQTDSASILLGNGNGAFVTPTSVPLGDGTKMVALADMNNDGKLDLVSLNALGNNISIALGNGNGTFLPAVNKAISNASSLKQFEITDLNGDGNLDVLTGGSSIVFSMGNGDGSLRASTQIADSIVLGFALGDANKDGTQDIVAFKESNVNFLPLKLGSSSVSDRTQQIFESPPTNLGATNGNGNAIVNFTAVPASYNLPPINYEQGSFVPVTTLNEYQYFLDGIFLPQYQSQPTTPPEGPYIVTQGLSTTGTVYGLTNGTNHTLKVRAKYKFETSYPPTEIISYTPFASVQLSPTAVPPTPAGPAPILASATNIINITASVPFTQANGSPTGYEYNLNNTGWVNASSSTSPLTLTGLIAGTNNSVRLRAVYAVNQDANPYSDASNEISFTTLSAPLAPLNLVATPGLWSATIAFTVPADGGSPITNYEYKVGTGIWTALNPVDITSPVTITGLTGGSALSIQLRGVNSYGDGTASTAVSVTPIGAPGAPSSTSVANSNGKATISFSITDGGAPITSIEYQISSNGGTSYSPWAPFNPVDSSSPVTITGLTNGTTYLVKLRGINSVNLTGAESATPITVAPVSTVPEAPTNLTALSGNASATIYFNASDNGGSPITNYKYSINGTTYTPLSPADITSPVVIPGLTNNIAYTITLKAVNIRGDSVASTSVQVTPSNAKPLFISQNTASFTVGTPARFDLLATGSPTYSITGNLPAGINLANGVLSGTPTVSGLYAFTVNATNSSGTTTQAFSMRVTGVPVFTTPDVTLFTQNSALSYTVSANDPNSPILNSEIFNSNFLALPDGWTTQGNAAIVNGAMQLTSATSNQKGWLTLPSLGANNPNGFYAKFDLLATGGSGADGTSFNYGVPATYANVTNSELSILSSGLSIGFVEYQDDRVEIRYNGTLLGTVFTPIESISGRTVEVLVDHSGKLTLWMDGKAITTVDLGSAYTNTVKNTWQFGFGARTATFTNRHEIDNLSISSVGISYSTQQNFFESNFTSASLPTGWQIGGDASVTGGGRLELNPEGTKQGYLVLPALGTTSPSAFSVSFDYAASNHFFDDGLATTLNYGVIPQSPSIGDFGDLLPGSGTTGLAITFNDDVTDSISVSFNGAVLTTQNPSGINFAPNFQKISVTMTEPGYLTVTVGSTHVIKNLLVSGYASADKSTWKFGFGANAGSTGFFGTAGFSSHTLDNLQISGLQSLPAGVSLNPLTGLLSGTPTGNASSYGFNIVSTNSAGIATQAFTLLNTNTQPAAPAATYLSTNIEGSTSGKTYRLAPGYTLPVGMFLTSAGQLRGTVPQHERGAYLVKFIATNTNTQVETSGYYVLRFSVPTATVSSTPYADPNPGVNNQFGKNIYPLATGNVLVTAPSAFEGKGAIYLYNGYTGNLISSLRGGTKGDFDSAVVTFLDNGNAVIILSKCDNNLTSTVVADAGAAVFVDASTGWGLNQQSPAIISASTALIGSTSNDFSAAGVVKLPNGNYLILLQAWDNGPAKDAGAVTLGNGTTGITGVISSSNSLVGTSNDDNVGVTVYILPNSNYVVQSANWDNGTVVNAGAVTLGNGTTGITGVVSSSNSLVGTSKDDQVGNNVQILSNGNYVVASANWDNGTTANAGAVTLGNGTTGITGAVSSSNSLVGTNPSDTAGSIIIPLANGNFVVSSNNWNLKRGAFTWVDGSVGLTGAISSTNSLVGSTENDGLSINYKPLANGNYVINLPNWDNGSVVDAGASIWGNGLTGVRGVISTSNSLVGSRSNDNIGSNIVAFSNGNYVLTNYNWDNGTVVDGGALTWVDGNRGITGTITSANSLVGTTAKQFESTQVTPLSNGNYLILAPKWDNGNLVDAGAVTFANGSQPITGTISSANSLVGTTANQFSGVGALALSNGNYVVYTPLWDSSTTVDVGAITWGSGTTGVIGNISASNSLVGSKQNDFLAYSYQGRNFYDNSPIVLANGNLVYGLRYFDNNNVVNAGAMVWISGSQPTTGVIGAANSLVGSTTGDLLSATINSLPNGNYLVLSAGWDNSGIVDAGAVTWGNGSTGTFGSISASNSLVGTTDNLGTIGVHQLKGSNNYLVSRPFGSVNGMVNAGSVTWVNGTAPLTGTISSANSLVGSAANDYVGLNISVFNNGNYAVLSPNWNEKRGAVTFGNSSTGLVGVISEQNSLVGTSPNDQVGQKATLLNSNSTVIFYTPSYDDPTRNLTNVGAATLFDGNFGTNGKVNSTNSYIGNVASTNASIVFATYDIYNRTFYAYFANETVNGFSYNGAINPSVIQPNINTAPTFTSANSATFKVGNNDSFQIAAKGLPEAITYSLQSGNLPNGITLTAQGLLSGTAAVGTGGTQTFTVRATNTTGFTDQVFTLTVTEEPVITSMGPLPAFVIGSNVANYTFTATGFPAPTFSSIDALPKGVTLSSSGILTGTPVSGTEGTYEFTVIASAGENLTARKTFSLTVNAPVAITSASGTSGHNGIASTFQVRTTGSPVANSFTLTGNVPSGVTIDNSGLISIASTTLAGNYSFSVNASNGVGNPDTQTFTLEVFGPPSITSATSTSFTIGTVGSFPFTASGNPNTFTFSTSDALPAGLVLSAQGVLSGTPEDGSSGSFTVDVKAYNGISSTNQSFTIQIAKAASSVSLVSGSNGSVNPGTPVTLTATVAGGSNQKAGTVTFKDGSTVIGTGKVDPSTGVATLITDSLASGSRTLTAEYSGNTAFLPSTSSTVTQVVRTVSTTTVTSSSLSAAYQSSVTFTATISTNATGTVDFFDGSNIIAQGVVINNGVATFSTSTLSAGPHSITAVYNGDSAFTTSTSSAISQSVIATSTTALSSSANSAVAYNTAVTFTATVSGSAGTPTGTVQFYLDDSPLGAPVTLSSGVATYTSLVNSGSNSNVPLPAGSLNIKAIYSGDSSYSNSTSSVVNQVVNSTTATAVTSSTASTLLGSTATFVARVTNTSGSNASAPTSANVSFFDGSTLLGTVSATPVASTNYSEATFTISNLVAGNHNITAEYAGDPQNFFSNSESSVLSHSVVLNTTTTVTATPANAFQNDQVTFSATVARTSAGAMPTGTITFFNGNTQLGSAVPLVNGVATYTTTFTNPGTQNITAKYSGDNGVTSTSEGSISKQILETQITSTVLASSANPSANGSAVTFTVTVSASSGTPTGTVTFFDGNTQLGTAVTLVNGVATLQTSALTNGDHFITAVYTSNANAFGTSTSTKFNQRVNQAPTITSVVSDSFLIGTSRTFNFTATGFPAPFFSTLGVLPKGLRLSSDGVLTGTPATGTGGIYSFTVVASNDFGQDASVSFTLTVNEPASFTSPDTTTFTSGAAESFRLAAKGFPAATFRVANNSTLPNGLSITSSVVNNETVWAISGTPEVGTGQVTPYTFVLEAVNNIGTAATQTFNLTINEPPSFTSPDSTIFTIGSYTNSFTLTTAGFPAPNLKLVSELPAGIRFQNGVLSGTPLFGSDRSYSLRFVASNNTGEVAIQNFTLNIAQVDPTLVAAPTTNDRTPFFSGTAEPNSQIELTIIRVGSNSSTTIYKTTSSGLNTENQLEPANWSIDLGSDTPDNGFLKSLADGNYIVMVVAIDVAGNRTAPNTGGTVLTFTVDATPPAAPVVTLASGSDSGVLGDLVTSNTRPTITGTAEANSAISLLINNLFYTTTASGTGSWSVDLATVKPTGGQSPMAVLADGKYEVAVTATDSFGNTSQPGIINVVIDSTAPIAPAITSPIVTSDTTPVIFGNAEINSVVTVVVTQRFNSTTISGPATFIVNADANGAWTLDLGTAVPTSGSIQPFANNAESYEIVANARDAAGNQNNGATGTQTLTFDRNTPEVVSASLTNQSFPILSGKANAGDTLLVVVNSVTYSTPVDSQGNWSLDTATATVVTGNRAAFTDGTYPVNLYYQGSNPSSLVAQNLVVDMTAPVITNALASFGTILNQKSSTQSAKLAIAITGIENEQTVTVTFNNATYTGLVFQGEATVTIPASALSALADGSSQSFSITAPDRAGNVSQAFTLGFTVDKSGPPCPTFVSITTTPNGDIGITPFTGYTLPVVTFRGEPGQTLVLIGPSGIISTDSYTVVETPDTSNLNQPASFYVITFTSSQASGDYQIKLVDQNGNENANETSPSNRANNFFNINSVPVVFDNQGLRSTQDGIVTGNLQVANVLNGQMFILSLDQNTQQLVNPRLQSDGTWIDVDGERVTFGIAEGIVIETDTLNNPVLILLNLPLPSESSLVLNVNTGSYTYTPAQGVLGTDTFQVYVTDASGNRSRLQLSFNPVDTLDRDGITSQSENALANLGGNQNGDLNQDGTADNRQASVSNLAWKTQQDFATATNPDTVQNTNSAAIITMVVNATAFDPSTTSTLAQLMSNVDPLAQLLQISVLSSNGLVADQSNLYKPWDLLDFTVESLVSTGLNDIDPNRDGTQVQVSIDISRANIPTTGLGFNLYRKLISASTLSDYFDAGISLTDLAGAPITTAGWYDFTQRTPGGDGASFKDFNNDGKVDAIILTLTDNSFGDNNPIANRLRDPGTPGSTVVTNPGGPNPSVPTPPGSNPPAPAPQTFAATGTSTGSVPGTTVNIYPTSTTTPSMVLVPFANWQGEVRIARADINGDGNLETIATMGEGGLPILRVFDGITGAQTMEIQVYDQAFNGGIFVAIGDLGNDGILDIVTGAGNGGGPHVKIFNAITGSETSSFMAYDINFRGGVSVAVGDIDGSGFAAIVTGAGAGGGPHVKVFNGTDHSLIKQFMAYASTFSGGVFVAVGDYLSDGKYEIITGAGFGGGPHIKIWDYETLNLDGQTMAFTDFTKPNGEVIDVIFTGGVRVALADANGDNVLDILAGAGPTGGPRVEVFAGFRLELLMDFFSGDKNDGRGVFVSQ